MLNFDRSIVKHDTQNIQNYCQQWLSDSFREHQIRYRQGLHRGPTGGAYSAPPDPLAGLRGSTYKEEGKKGTREGRGEGERKGTGVPPPPHFANYWIRPNTVHALPVFSHSAYSLPCRVTCANTLRSNCFRFPVITDN